MHSSGLSRSPLKRFLQSKLQSVTTVHGANHAAGGRGGGRRAAWLVALLANAALMTAFLLEIRDNHDADQIVTKINANCKIDQVPFPAVSICNFNMISSRETANITALLKKNKRTNDEIEIFFKNLPYLKDYKKIQDNVTNLMETMTILKRHYYTIDNVMEEVHQKCEDLLLYCTFNRKSFDCSDMFRLTKTFEGYCCMFNYGALSDSNEDQGNFGEKSPDWEYYIDNGEVTNLISTSEFGRSSGLSVVFDVEPDDYPAWSPTRHHGAKIVISDPNDFAETTVLSRAATPGEALELKLQPLVFASEAGVRGVPPAARRCWFHDEAALRHTPRYSFETCMTECAMAGYKRLCRCLPYKYPAEKSTKLCEFEDIDCLLNITVLDSTRLGMTPEQGVRRVVACQPVCYSECVDKKYSMSSDAVPLSPAHLPPAQPASPPAHSARSRGLIALRVYYKKATCSCYTLTLLMDYKYFIATYGGVFSLFFGGSLITIFEICFLVLSTFVSFIRRKMNSSYIHNHYYIP